MSKERECQECGASGSSLIYHEHHILPIRLGGSEDSTNKKILCPYCHSFAHLMLFLEHGDERDLIASNGLSGMVDKESIVAELRNLGLRRAQERTKELWEDETYRESNLPQVLALQKLNQEKLRELWKDPDWSNSQRAKMSDNLRKAREKNKLEPSDKYLENIKGFGQRCKKVQARLREEDPEWRERELENIRLASAKSVEKRAWLKENCPEYQEKLKRLGEATAERNRGTYWVNNGLKSKRVPTGDPIPEGYELGKRDKRKKKPTENESN